VAGGIGNTGFDLWAFGHLDRALRAGAPSFNGSTLDDQKPARTEREPPQLPDRSMRGLGARQGAL